MSSEPSIEDHVAFRKLLAQNNPVAVEVHAAFSATRDHAAFNAGVIRSVRGVPVEANTPKLKSSLPKTANPQTKTPNNSAAKPVAICRHMQSTGNCKSGSSCKFSHDIAARDATAMEPKLGKVPLSKADKPNKQSNTAQKLSAPNTPSRQQNRLVAGTPDNKTTEAGDILDNPPASPVDRAAAKSRFLGMFGVRSSATHPATEEAPLMPPNAVPASVNVAHTAVPSAKSVAMPTAASADAASTATLVSPPRREHAREKGLEDLLFDSPPSSKQFWNEVNSANNTATNPHGALDLDLSLDFGKLNFDNVPLSAPVDTPADASALSESWKAPPGPPGFGNAPFPFPMRPENGFPYPSPHGGPPGQYVHPFGGLMPPPGGLFPPPPQGMQEMPGMYPPPPLLPLPNGMPVNGMPPPMGPYGGFPPAGFGYGPPPGHLMPPPPHQQQHLPPQFGQHGQMYQTTTCAPVRSTLSDFPAPPASTSHLSVHDMLGHSIGSGVPMSPGADERSRQLLRLLNGGGAPLPSTTNAAPVEPGSSTDTTSPFSKSLQVPVSSAVGGPQQKSRALLSLLKSSKAGPTLALNGAPPTPTSVGSSSAASSVAPSSPVSQTRPPAGPTNAPTPALAPQFTTPIKGKNRSQSITSDVGDDAEPHGAATPGGNNVAATPARKASFFRNTKFQCGHMQIAVNGVIRNHHVMAPSTNMAVHWQMPQEDFHTLMNKPNTALVIGLVRYGSYTNSPCFVSKQIERRPKLARDSEGHPIYAGTVVFHAPKSAGQFVYRLFDESSKDSALTTLATSPMFSVDLADFYVNTNLRHILEALSEKSKVKGISQMPAVIRGIRNAGRNDRASGSSEQMVAECFQIVLRAVEDAIPAIETWKERKRAIAAEEKETGKESALATGKEAEEGKTAYKQAMRVQGEAFAAISSLLESRAPFLLLSPAMRDIVSRQQSLFCPHLNRYFRDAQHMQAYRIEEIGFNVALDQPFYALAQSANISYGEIMSRMDASIEALLPRLMPRADFQQARETAVAQLQLALITEHAVPPDTEVALYGSSNNTFGSDGADMDMTLLFPPGIRLTAEDKPVVIERLGAVLTRIGMTSVTTRATARIPIVQFKDPLHSFDCDISLQNQLAVANTKLLRTYGSIDPRVRKLVFLLKHWAKSRHLNSPSDGTLSSYGFILCLIHFLQNRPVPLVPNLQNLPPVWNGARRPAVPLPVHHLDNLSHPPVPHGGSNAHGHSNNNKAQEQADALSHFERQSMPKVYVPSADNIKCNAYFYTPTLAQPQLLPDFARENQESVAELFIEFFRFFAWHFDFRHQVVSVRQSSGLSKLDKAEQHGWLQSDVLSIEDPFETHYDVAHVIKSAQMVYFRKELLRAHTLASRVFAPSPIADSLPASVAPEDFLTLLCEPAELPAFAGARDRLVSVDVPAA